MAATIKARITLAGDVATVRLLVKHPMDVGGRGADGEVREPHFIREITCIHAGEVVMIGHWGAGIAKNPYLSFSFDGARKGDELVISWIDNREAHDEFRTVL